MYSLLVNEVRVYLSKDADLPIVSNANDEVAKGKTVKSLIADIARWAKEMDATISECDFDDDRMYVKIDFPGVVLECEITKTGGEFTQEEKDLLEDIGNIK